MISSEVSRRYARAFFELGSENGSLDTIVSDFTKLAEVYSENAELRAALTDPMVALDAKRGILSAIAQRLGATPVSTRGLLLLGDRRRLAALPQIATTLRELADKKRGVSRAEILSAKPLSESHQTALKAQLDRLTGKQIVLDITIDPSLIAGVVVRIGDTVLDGSIRARLAEAKQNLLPN